MSPFTPGPCSRQESHCHQIVQHLEKGSWVTQKVSIWVKLDVASLGETGGIYPAGGCWNLKMGHFRVLLGSKPEWVFVVLSLVKKRMEVIESETHTLPSTSPARECGQEVHLLNQV